MRIETLGKLLYNIDALGERSLYLIQLIIAGSWITEEPVFVYVRTYVAMVTRQEKMTTEKLRTNERRSHMWFRFNLNGLKRKPSLYNAVTIV